MGVRNVDPRAGRGNGAETPKMTAAKKKAQVPRARLTVWHTCSSDGPNLGSRFKDLHAARSSHTYPL
eukprot:1142781-Pelagomonas_calceolata.AAC.1